MRGPERVPPRIFRAGKPAKRSPEHLSRTAEQAVRGTALLRAQRSPP
jgi:hypothetical protein